MREKEAPSLPSLPWRREVLGIVENEGGLWWTGTKIGEPEAAEV